MTGSIVMVPGPRFCRLHPDQPLVRLEAEIARPAVYVHADGTVHADLITDKQTHAREHTARVYHTGGWVEGIDRPDEKWGASCEGECGGHYRAADLIGVYEKLALTPCKLPEQAKLYLQQPAPNPEFLAELRRLTEQTEHDDLPFCEHPECHDRVHLDGTHTDENGTPFRDRPRDLDYDPAERPDWWSPEYEQAALQGVQDGIRRRAGSGEDTRGDS